MAENELFNELNAYKSSLKKIVSDRNEGKVSAFSTDPEVMGSIGGGYLYEEVSSLTIDEHKINPADEETMKSLFQNWTKEDFPKIYGCLLCINVLLPLFQLLRKLTNHHNLYLFPEEEICEWNMGKNLTPVLADEVFEFLNQIGEKKAKYFLGNYSKAVNSNELLYAWKTGLFEEFKEIYDRGGTQTSGFFAAILQEVKFAANLKDIDFSKLKMAEQSELLEDVIVPHFNCTPKIESLPEWAQSYISITNISSEIIMERCSKVEEPVKLSDAKLALSGLWEKYIEIKDSFTKYEQNIIDQIMIVPDNKEMFPFYKELNDIVSSVIYKQQKKEVFDLPPDFFEGIVCSDDTLYVSEIPKKFRNSNAWIELINFFAEKKFIEDDIATKKSIAFVLTGYGYSDELDTKILWSGKPEALIYLANRLYKETQGTLTKKYDKMGVHFICSDEKEQIRFHTIIPNRYSAFADDKRTQDTHSIKEKLDVLFPKK